MIKKFLASASVVAALALGACDTTGGVVPPTSTTNTLISQIQAGAATACSFVPTVETVTGIVSSFISGGSAINSMASAVVNAICGAVTPKAGAKRRGGAPVVNGVRVQGYFTR